MAVSYAAVVLALAATVFASCPEKHFLESFDKSQLIGVYDAVHWPKYYDGVFKCGREILSVNGNHLDFAIDQYDIANSKYTNFTGRLWQVGTTSKFYGLRHGIDDLMKFYVTGFSQDKYIVYWVCRESTGDQKSFSLKKRGVVLSPEDEATLKATLPLESSFYSPATYGSCPEI